MTNRYHYVPLESTIHFWFASNDTSGSGDDGATPLFDVRLGGAAAGAAPVLSGTPDLLAHANYPDGCYEVTIPVTAANGFADGNTYAVFCTLLVDGQNPTGLVGQFVLGPPPTLEGTAYFWFGANDTAGSGADGAAAVYDVRLAGDGAAAVPIISGAATLLTHANYPDGCYELAIPVTAAMGFVARNGYAVFGTLAVDGQNPTGFIGSFWLQAELVAAATPDLSADQLLLDGLEDVYLNGVLSENACRLSLVTREGDPSYAAYLRSDTIWHLSAIVPIDPAVGDTITAAGGFVFNVLEVRRPWLNNYWECITRQSAVTSDTGLRDLVTLWPVVVATDAYASRVATHPTADPNFTDVPAKVQLQYADPEVVAGKLQFKRLFDIYLARDIDVGIGDLIIDQNSIQYDIDSFRNRDRIDQLSHIVANYRE